MNKPKIIILEGCDKTGKTTLAKEICRQLGYKYVKVSNPKGDPYQEYKKLIKEVKEPTLFDRLHIGEPVYGPVMRKVNLLPKDKFNHIEDLLLQHDAKIVYTHNTHDFIEKKFDEDNETFLKKEDIAKIVLAYEITLRWSRLPIFRYKIGDGYDWINKLK